MDQTNLPDVAHIFASCVECGSKSNNLTAKKHDLFCSPSNVNHVWGGAGFWMHEHLQEMFIADSICRTCMITLKVPGNLFYGSWHWLPMANGDPVDSCKPPSESKRNDPYPTSVHYRLLPLGTTLQQT